MTEMHDQASLEALLNDAQTEVHALRDQIAAVVGNGPPPALGSVTLLTTLQDAREQLSRHLANQGETWLTLP